MSHADGHTCVAEALISETTNSTEGVRKLPLPSPRFLKVVLKVMLETDKGSWQEAQLAAEQTGGSGQGRGTWNKILVQHISGESNDTPL